MGEQRRRHHHSARFVLGLSLVVMVLTAAAASPAPGMKTAMLTVEGSDSYSWLPTAPETSTGNRLVVHAAGTNQGTNLRSVWWAADETVSRDQQSCVTWRRNTGVEVQPGVALRIRSSGDSEGSEVRAITISNNVWVGNRAAWNIHTWVASRGQPAERELVGQLRFIAALGQNPLDLPPLPWRICGRAVGSTVAVKVWALRSGRPEPSWGDIRYGAVFALPVGWDAPGRPGGYTGHLEPGSEIEFSAETTDVVAVAGVERLGVQASAVARTASYQTLGMALSQ